MLSPPRLPAKGVAFNAGALPVRGAPVLALAGDSVSVKHMQNHAPYLLQRDTEPASQLSTFWVSPSHHRFAVQQL